MKHKDIRVGGLYQARVGANITIVRVDAIREVFHRSQNGTYVYDVVNLKTKRRVTFRSCQRFRREAVPMVVNRDNDTTEGRGT